MIPALDAREMHVIASGGARCIARARATLVIVPLDTRRLNPKSLPSRRVSFAGQFWGPDWEGVSRLLSFCRADNFCLVTGQPDRAGDTTPRKHHKHMTRLLTNDLEGDLAVPESFRHLQLCGVGIVQDLFRFGGVEEQRDIRVWHGAASGSSAKAGMKVGVKPTRIL